MIEGRLLDRLISAAEMHDVAWHAVEFRRLIMTAVAGASLEEISTGTTRMPKRVLWVAMSCRPKESASWQAIELGDANPNRSEPIPLAISEPLRKGIHEFVQRLEDQKLDSKVSFLTPLTLGHPISMELIPEADVVYVRCSPMRLPESVSPILVAWLVGASDQMEATEEARVDSGLAQAERIVGDRLLYGLGGYRPVASILASIDESFRHSMDTARSARGLSEFLELLETDGIRPSHQEPEPLLRHEDVESTIATPFSDQEIETVARTKVEEYFGGSAQLIRVAKDGKLRTPFGEWHAWVEFGGFSGFRTKAVLVSLCGNCQHVEHSIANYLATRSRPGDVRLVLLLYGDEVKHQEYHEKTWNRVGGIWFGTMR
jgi:hypothetical protein